MDVTTSRCLCAGTPHDGDTITFIDRPDFRRAVAMQKSLTILKGDDPTADAETTLAVLVEAYLIHGITAWSLVYGSDAVDDKGRTLAGQPLPVTRATIVDRVLSQVDVAMEMADDITDLYDEVVLLPLLRRAVTSSPATPTTDGTSAPTGSQPTSPTPSSPSSITTIPTADTATTSPQPGGGSKSSPKRASVA